MQKNSSDSFVLYVYEGLISLLRTLWWTVRSHFLFFMACLILGGGFMFLREFQKRNLYEASFTVIYDELVRKIYGDRLAKLNELIQVKEYQKAGQLMDLDPVKLEGLVEVRGENILGESLTQDLNTDKIPFVVKLVVRDTGIVNAVQEGVMHFLEGGNPYLVSRTQMKLDGIRTELDFIDRQLALMDSQSRSGATMILATPASSKASSPVAGNLYAYSYELYQRKQELRKKLEMPSGLHVIDDAIVPVRLGGNWMIHTLMGMAVGIALFFFVQWFIFPVFREGRL